jgi:hypothetical protein
MRAIRDTCNMLQNLFEALPRGLLTPSFDCIVNHWRSIRRIWLQDSWRWMHLFLNSPWIQIDLTELVKIVGRTIGSNCHSQLSPKQRYQRCIIHASIGGRKVPELLAGYLPATGWCSQFVPALDQNRNGSSDVLYAYSVCELSEKFHGMIASRYESSSRSLRQNV